MGTTNNKNSKMMLWRKLKVGSEIAVYWKEYKGYFACSVIKKSGRDSTTKNKPRSLFQVEYEDGTIEWTDMSKAKFRWQDLDDEEFDDDVDNDNDNDDDDDNEEEEEEEEDKTSDVDDDNEEEEDKICDVDDDKPSDDTFKRKTTTSSTSSNKRMKKEEDNVEDDNAMQVALKRKSTGTEDNDKSGDDDFNKDDGTKDEVNDDEDDDCMEEANEEDDEEEAYDDEDDANQKKQKQLSARAKKVNAKKKKSNKDGDVQELSEKISKSPIEEVNPDSGEALKQEKNDDAALPKEDEDGANNNVGDGLKEDIKKKHGVARKDVKKSPVKKKSTKAKKELSHDKTTSAIKRLSSKEVKKAHDNKELTKQNALLYIMVNHHMVGQTYLTFEHIFKNLGFKPKNKAIEQAWKEVREKGLVEEANVSGGGKKHFQLTPEGIDFAASEDYKNQLANPPRTTEQLHEQIKASANEYGVQIFDLLLKNGSMSTDELADECGVSKNGHKFFYGFKQHKTFGYVIKDQNNKRANWILSPDKAFIIN
jgi:hypothetical protein